MPTIRHRRATQAQWESLNPVLASGEIGYEIGTSKFKVGDGLTEWVGLEYFVDEAFVRSLLSGGGSGGGGASIDDASVDALDKTWSANKLTESLQGYTMSMTTGEIKNIQTNEVATFEDLNGLSMAAAYAYAYGMEAYNKASLLKVLTTETKQVYPGPLAVGTSPEAYGFHRIPTRMGDLNYIYPYMACLDTPSTSGDVVFQLSFEHHSGSVWSTAPITIPQGETLFEINRSADDQLNSVMIEKGSNGDDVGVHPCRANITQAGTGATGLTISIIRSSKPIS